MGKRCCCWMAVMGKRCCCHGQKVLLLDGCHGHKVLLSWAKGVKQGYSVDGAHV